MGKSETFIEAKTKTCVKAVIITGASTCFKVWWPIDIFFQFAVIFFSSP